ncbi:hypothetical protein QEB74_004058 [Escherichia coli]|nr:hypothetical protein [Escherichia coli]EKT3736796.1 hypothetical protein [Escherichia coli]
MERVKSLYYQRLSAAGRTSAEAPLVRPAALAAGVAGGLDRRESRALRTPYRIAPDTD